MIAVNIRNIVCQSIKLRRRNTDFHQHVSSCVGAFVSTTNKVSCSGDFLMTYFQVILDDVTILLSCQNYIAALKVKP